MESAIRKRLKELKERYLKRRLTLISGPQEPWVRVNGRRVLLLCSNNYLGLANHPELKEAAMKAVEKYGVGSGASRLVSGTMEAHKELEEKLKRFKKKEAVLLFNSGWHANTGIIPQIIGRGGEIFSDKLNHASIIDGCVLSRAAIKRYSHCDAGQLKDLIKKSTARRKLIITDGVFSMDGDIPPLKEIIEIAEKYGATVFLDDAHSVGVFGKRGRGTLEYLGIERPLVIEMGTLGKAFGSYGAFVAGSKKLIELLINRGRRFIYSTSLPPAVCAASIRAITIVEREPERRERLFKNASYLRDSLKKGGFDILKSSTHIIPLVTGDAKKTMAITERLLKKGIFCQGIRPPSVPSSRLRITVTSEHTEKDLRFDLGGIKEVFEGNFS